MKQGKIVLRVLYMLVTVFTVGLMVQLLWQNDTTEHTEAAKGHFAILMPVQTSDAGSVHTAIEQLAEEYSLALEVHEFATVADQKQMLRLRIRIKLLSLFIKQVVTLWQLQLVQVMVLINLKEMQN